MPEVTPFEAALADLAKELIAGGGDVAPERSVSVPTQTLGGQRMRGAREFAVFLLGRGHRKGERTKGRI